MQNIPLILKPGKVKSSILLVISIGFVVLGISLLDRNMLIAILNIVFFGLCFIVFLLNLIPGSSYLKIDEKGIEMKNLFRTTFIPWQAVSSFETKWVAFNKLVIFNLNKNLAGEKLKRRIARMHQLMLRLVEYPKMSVAAINGLALGGGLEIAMACTFRVAAPQARLGLPEITHALMPAYGGTQLLPRLVGVGRALELALSGEMIDAQRAKEIGLLNAVADDPLAAAIALAARCSRHGQVAQREIRRAMLGGICLPLADGLALEAQGALRVAESEEARAGVAAFTKSR